jgi:hypothetical protein
MTDNPNPVLAIAAMFARISGQDPPEIPPATPRAELTSTFIPDRLMARSRITGSIEIAGELIELRRGRSALWVGHPAVTTYPDLFEIPSIEQEPEPDPPQPAPGPPICWTDGVRSRAHFTLGRRHGDRRR